MKKTDIKPEEDSLKKPKKITHHAHGHRQRLRARLLENPHSLQEYEILELLLTYAIPRKDTKALAKEFLHRFGSFRNCFHAEKAEVEDMPFAGESVYSFTLLLREFLARYMESKVKEKKTFLSLEDFVELSYVRLASCSDEEVWVALLDSQNRLIRFECIAKGGISYVYLHARTVVEKVIETKASGIFLFHNHPGGNLNPSAEDIEMTRHLAEMIEKLGVRFLEHMIITEKGCLCILAEKFFSV